MKWHHIEDAGDVVFWCAVPSRTMERDDAGRRRRRDDTTIMLGAEPDATARGFGYVLAKRVEVTEAHVREAIRV